MLSWRRDELYPDHDVSVLTAEAHPGASSEQAKDVGSLLSGNMETERAASEHSSHNDKVFEELLEVVTNAVARLKLDCPQEQENPRHSKLYDRFLSGGKGERSQHRSLPFFPDFHDELSRSWSKPYSSRNFGTDDVDLFDYRGC